MARWLVTGGGGFIGSNLTEALLRRGETVRVMDDFSTGRRSNLDSVDAWAAEADGTFELHETDLRDPEACAAAVAGVDHVLHEAAIPSVQRSVSDPLTTHAVNVNGTLNLLEASRHAGVRRFVMASSSALYGESETLPKVESMPLAPISPYGLQKLAGESYTLLYDALYGLRTVALRYFNVFGPRQDPASDYSAVIPRFIGAIRAGRSATIYGDGEQTRDFTFIENVVQANVAACEAPESACGKAYNIAWGERISLNSLLGELGRLADVDATADHAAPRDGDIRDSLADVSRARDALGYRPTVDLGEGLKRTLEAF